MAVNTPDSNLGANWATPGPYFDLEESQSKSGNPVVRVLHALRRKWLVIFVLGCIVAGGVGFGVYQMVELEFTAVTRLLMPRANSILPEPRGNDDPLGYATFRTNQIQMITGPEVLSSALGRIGDEPLVRAQEDPLDWMMDQVSANFPDDSDILTISFRCSDQRASVAISEAILDTYIDEILLVDLHGDEEHLQEVEAEAQKVRDEFKRKQSQLIGLEEARDRPGTKLTPQQAAARTQLLSELEKVAGKLRELNLQKALLDRLNDKNGDESGADASDDSDLPASEIDAQIERLMAQNVEVENLEKRIRGIEQRSEKTKKNLRPEFAEPYLQADAEEIAANQARIAEIREDYRQQLLRQLEAGGLEPDGTRDLAFELQYYESLQAELLADLGKLPVPQDATPVPRSSELELLRMEIDNVSGFLSRLEQERKATEMAISNSPFKAFEQRMQTNRPRPLVTASADQQRRLVTCAASGVLGFLVIAALVVLFDLRIHRLNSAEQIPEQLKLNVIGSIPLLRKNNRSEESSSRLAEAVDGVAAALLCQTTGDDHRIIQVASAIAGEGKTTLAANLATSLAAAGRKTLLIDFDLRRPMLHNVYGLELSPGVCELLAGTAQLGELFQESPHDNLWIVPAGLRTDRRLARLTDNRIAALFAQLRAEYDFIVVDGPPVLPVVDARLIARHVDGVLFSLLRDVSEVPKVRSAYELLESYRAKILGGVIIGTTGDVYYSSIPSQSQPSGLAG